MSDGVSCSLSATDWPIKRFRWLNSLITSREFVSGPFANLEILVNCHTDDDSEDELAEICVIVAAVFEEETPAETSPPDIHDDLNDGCADELPGQSVDSAVTLVTPD